MNIEGTIKKIKFLNEITHWGVIQFIKDDGTKFIAKGKMGPQYPGYKLILSGDWVPNQKGGGHVFDVTGYMVKPPESTEGIFLFLTSGIFKGITVKIAKALVDLYGDKTLKLLDSDINVLLTVKGVGPKLFMKIRDSYEEAKPQQERLFKLINDYKFTFTEALMIISKFPENALVVLEKAPYSMYRKLDKIPFLRFDQVIMAQGCPPSDPQRVRESIHYHMKATYRDGHTLISKFDVIRRASDYLDLDRYQIENELQYLIDKRRVFSQESKHGTLLQSKWFYTAEKEIANRLSLMMKTPAEKELIFDPNDKRLEKLKSHQLRAVVAPFHNKVSIITGRPGAGKTTLLKTILDTLESQNVSILAVSPTGKASQRLREVTKRDCSTIHRALGATHLSDEFMFNDVKQLDFDVIVVDETSMLETSILRSLLRAIPPTSRLVLIGDVEQLPSVGPGAVYRDLINSGCFAVYWLTEVLRMTSKDGALPTPLHVSNGIRDGIFYNPPNDNEWAYHPTVNNAQTIDKIKSVINELKKDGVGYEDIQVFSPVNDDELGVGKLNEIVKRCFFENGLLDFEVGDKIMQRENNYELDVFNGDIGIVKEIYATNGKTIKADEPYLLADMSGRRVEFTKKDLYNLSLAYAITGHKSQGSEYPHVLIVIPDNHISLMDRYWLYTLVTRCQAKAHLIGNHNVVVQTIKNKKSHLRQTLLLDKVRKFSPVINMVFD